MRGLATPAATGDLEHASAEEVLAHMLEHHHPRLALACSFQKEEAVLIDMLLKLEPSARVFTIDTGVLFPETYRTWRELESRYGLQVEIFDAEREADEPWNVVECCSARKVAALDLALEDLDGIWKANPIADWDAKAVWDYIARNDVPYNALHDRGYESIGCMPCTLPGSGREGRWAGSDKTECGIHV
jgi:phosphoadenosine phosphosulfate reductase